MPDPPRITSLESLADVARHHGMHLSVERLRRDYTLGEGETPAAMMIRVGGEIGLRLEHTTLSWADLRALPPTHPVLGRLDNDNWVVVLGVAAEEDEEAALVRDPLAGETVLRVPRSRFEERFTGEALLVTPAALAEEAPRFGLAWFVPELFRERRLFGEVALAALFLCLLGLSVPIFFQIVIDKVLVHQSYATLQVLLVGVLLALVFDAVFGFLRRYLLIYATNRVDIRITTRTFAHLLRLPIDFFERMPAGVVVRHLQQAGRVREFLTGRMFLTLLDSMTLLVFLPILFLYSARLALVVLGFALVAALVIGAVSGPFRRRLAALHRAEGERQALLVESVHGMRTLKSLAMEPRQRQVWDARSAGAVRMRHEVEKVSALAQSATGLLEKSMMVAIVGLGALLVFDGQMTIGALVAFNMLAGRVSGPLLQLVGMAHEYQDVAMSVRMLGEVMGAEPERAGRGQGITPPIDGALAFEGVSFRYPNTAAPALDDVSFQIAAGGVLGIVGRSGSGKSTLTKLLQGLHTAQEGVLRIDGHDIREFDLAHLRHATGVVLQENFLFRGTVRQNIAAPRPDARPEEIAEAARLAGADEFIERLPRGFDTEIEEGGQNLSGGQRQRLAIARALITRPRLLILDEATSALDPESEAIVRRNLRRIAEGRTVLIVSHRLATLVDAHAILVMDRGRVVDVGRHGELLQRCTDYRALWNQQMRVAA
ncbi:peptidase domain-containing ABC transporter [Roseomonas terrae]|jgi:subfamily B ATP-binding cassette protein HlyB/CyaB|uniref:Peptidase domain-containing ABC transporter n=1 Tax=Neoroseomonas terrae TaxID=424799 RepID=A0ABS5EKK3_9PROT|nr:peptidase domain-containing ABC transporter [Neoroseomonas terrae]MBR0651500.1 peptidase domain-containing ABC transporter [Neoroseomonas terrae]